MRIKQKEYNLLTKNQLHKPLKKAREQGAFDEKCKVFFKSGNSSMLLCKGMTKLASQCLTEYIERYCKKHGSKVEGMFIFTH